MIQCCLQNVHLQKDINVISFKTWDVFFLHLSQFWRHSFKLWNTIFCLMHIHFQCICVQQNFLLMKIKSLFLSSGKILNKMMFNAFKERDTILKENIFVIFCLLTIGRFLLSIEPLELYFSFVNGKMKRLLKKMPLSVTWNDLLLGHYSNP